MAEPAARPGLPGRGCLIARPGPGAAETAARVSALGWEPVLAPALLLTPVPLALAPGAAAALLPSPAAIPSLAAIWAPGRPVLAVGEGTARAARAAGLHPVEAAEGDAASLAVLASARLDPAAGPLLLAAGRGYGVDLAAELARQGFAVQHEVAYEAEEAEALPGAARAALESGRVGAALFFSPRSAQATMGMLRRAGLQDAATGIRALALSGRIAISLSDPGGSAGAGWREVAVAPRPDQDALLALLGPFACTPPRGASEG